MKVAPRNKGFSLIEAILAMAILAASFLGISHVLSNTTMQNIDIDISTTAILLARGVMEETRSKAFSSVSSVSSTNFGGDFSSYSYSISVSYVDESDPDTVSGSATDLKKVVVAVTATNWPGTIQLTDLKADLE